MMQSGSNKKVANSLVAMSCGAVLVVYTAGYDRTRAAVDRFEAQAAERRREVLGPPPSAPFLERFQPSPPPDAFKQTHSSAAPNPAAPGATGEPRLIASTEPLHTTSNASGVASSSSAETPMPPSPVPVAAVVASPMANLTPEPTPQQVEHKAEVAAAAPTTSAPMWKDGSYLGWGTSRHGDIQAEVVVEGGRIASATIAQCRTRYSCSVIDRLPPQVAQRQSPDVDYVSGATQSANAFYFAVVDALSKAK
jgi:uncharacterized protein with FMN-binding domain